MTYRLQLPDIGFNYGRYDVNVFKQFLALHPPSMNQSKEEDEEDEEEEEDRKDERRDEGNVKAERYDKVSVHPFFVIKRGNTFMCLSTDQLT